MATSVERSHLPLVGLGINCPSKGPYSATRIPTPVTTPQPSAKLAPHRVITAPPAGTKAVPSKKLVAARGFIKTASNHESLAINLNAFSGKPEEKYKPNSLEGEALTTFLENRILYVITHSAEKAPSQRTNQQIAETTGFKELADLMRNIRFGQL